ncbi:MAG: YfjI family protein, partial [Verrucomicrobiota bacterium]|nr:YfjI family protein [Verrucomicrobiota bacterium]
HNQEQLASLSPDAGSIVNILLGRYSKNDRTDESIYLKAFSGDSCRVDRQGREPVMLQSPCLSALWLTQPDKIETLLAERSLTEGGMIPRLLPCHTRAEARLIVDGVEGISATTATAWANLIRRLLKTFRMAREPFTIEPASGVWELMKEHHNQIVERRNGDLRDVTTYAARWNEQAWRISVCLHAGLHDEFAGERNLQIETATSAIVIADWFAEEQLRILSRGRHAARRNQLEKVLKLLADNPKGITARDVHRAHLVDNANEAHALLTRLETGGELTGKNSKPETGGHITRTYTKARK